jgi:hypothetical protein
MLAFDTDAFGWTQDADGLKLTVRTAMAKEIAALQGKHTVEIKEYRKKRSLDANAYAWCLIDKIAAAMHISKAEVYRNAIKEIGGVSDVVCVRKNAADALCEGWQHNGLGWFTERTESKIDGCVNVVLYYGSSSYNTAQMSRLIDSLIADAKELGIETMTPAELERLEGYGEK